MVRILAFLTSALLALPAAAGTLCGTVRDAQTSAPIAGAAVFVFDDQGAYTGLNTGTAGDGTWCIADVPAGTYTLQVERDDYRLATVDGVVVEDTATDVGIRAFTGALLAPVMPNPSSARVNLRWRVAEGRAFRLEIVDVRGRRVEGWRGTGSGNDATLAWDLRGFDERRLPSGTYFAVLRSEDERRVQRIAIVR